MSYQPKTTAEQRKELVQYLCNVNHRGAKVQRIVDDLAACEAALAEEQQRHQWQPIETAPKDGTLILGWDTKVMRGKGAACVMLWARNETTQKHEWMNFWNAYRVDGPTHWQPLPQPPERRV